MATWTEAQRDALAAAIARGVRSVSYADRTVTYESLAEMRSLLAEMDRQLGSAQTFRFARVSKGV